MATTSESTADSKILPFQIGNFLVKGVLGRGGMGVVYEAWDELNERSVALKAIQLNIPSALYRLKLEYRQVSSIVHPNLVGLYDLTYLDGHCYIVMEYIEGQALSHVIANTYGLDNRLEALTSTKILADSPYVDQPEVHWPPNKPFGSDINVLDIARQLAQGIFALHVGGVLHLDIKPSNMILKDDGQIKLLDFGVAQLINVKHRKLHYERAATLQYVSPEYLDGEVPTAASDWYSFGVVVFELITGKQYTRRLFHRNPHEQAIFDEVTLTLLNDYLPSKITLLLERLLNEDPLKRPPDREILEVFNIHEPLWRIGEEKDENKVFIGRQDELEQLSNAFDCHREGKSNIVNVVGAPGVGKSELINHFLDTHKDSLILVGRCYERETVPFKALDMVIDDFSEYLKSLPATMRDSYVVDGFEYLAILFPVLKYLVPDKTLNLNIDAAHCRILAMKALASSLALIVNDQPVIIFIDDIQWGDEDSANLLINLMEFQSYKKPFIVLSERSGGDLNSRFTSTLNQFWSNSSSDMQYQTIEVESFDEKEGMTLVDALLGNAHAISEQRAQEIVRVSRGIPFILEQLLLYYDQTGAMENINAVGIIKSRLDVLSNQSREVLSLLAIAGQPVKVSAILEAAGVSNIDDFSFTCLRAQRFLIVQHDESVQYFHDQIRESVLILESENRVEEKARKLALVLEKYSDSDNSLLGRLFYQGGEDQKAISFMLRAADDAESSLAFSRAADLYQNVINWLPDSEFDESRRVKERKAIAWSKAGYGKKAAQLFSDLMRTGGVSDEERARLGALAAEQFMYGGHIEEGEKIFRPLLKKWRLPYPSSIKLATISIIYSALLLELKRRRLSSRAFSRSQKVHPKIELAFSVAQAMGNWDPIRSLHFSLIGLRLAISANDLPYIVQGLNIYALVRSYGGKQKDKEVSDSIFKQASSLAKQLDDPANTNYGLLLKGIAHTARSELRQGIQMIMEAESQFSQRLVDTKNNSVIARTTALNIYWQMGELNQIGSLAPGWIQDAKARGDKFSLVELNMFLGIYDAARGDYIKGREMIVSAIESWPLQDFTFQHWVASKAITQIDLLSGREAEAWPRLQQEIKLAKKAGLFDSVFVRIDFMFLKGRVALACAESGNKLRPSMIKVAQRESDRLRKENNHAAKGLGFCLLAAVARLRNQPEQEILALKESCIYFELAQMELYLLAMNNCLAKINREQSTLKKIKDRFIDLGVKDPERYQIIYYPYMAYHDEKNIFEFNDRDCLME